MSDFEEKIKRMLKCLEEKIAGKKEKKEINKGIEVCMKQGSRNFENWIQVELVAILKENKIFKNDDIRVEARNHGNADIFIDHLGCEKESIAIEIKVARLGGKDLSHAVPIGPIKKDIEKLRELKGKRVLLCVAYKADDSFEKSWEGENGYRKEIERCIKKDELDPKSSPCPSFKVKVEGRDNEVEVLLDYFIF